MQIIHLPKREISSMMSCMTYYSFAFSKEVYLQECLFSFQTTAFLNKRFNSLTELLLLLNFTIFIMQEHQKLLKKTNKSAVEQRTLDLRQKQNQLQALLRIDLITIPEKMAQNKRIQSNISRETTSRNSHKSLAINLQKYAKPPKDKPKKQNLPPKVQTAKVKKPDTEKTSEKQTIEQKKQRTNSIKAPTQYAKQPIQHEFVEKKTKVGQKIKTNAMKEFILQTLMKGKAEGTCLVIHKGTAHCSYSPIAKNKSETSKHQKEQYPLILVQNHKDAIERRNRPNQSTFGQRPTKVNKSSSTKSTAVNLPSINKKLVKMAKQLQKKQNKKLQANESIIEVIEQKIEACEEQKENQIEQIHQQILVSNNESIIKGNVKIE